MITYLEELGLEAKLTLWKKAEELPVYLRNNREYYTLYVDQRTCIVIKIAVTEFNISSFEKQVKKIQAISNDDIILWFENISSYQRQALIKNRISFVVPGSQMFVPVLGICLKERMQQDALEVIKLSAMSQLILLYMIYNPLKSPYTQSMLAKVLDISAMNVHRGLKELIVLQLVTVEVDEKDKKTKRIIPVESGKKLYLLAKKYMLSPIQKKVYVKEKSLCSDFLIAGQEALANRTMLSPPVQKIRAVYKKEKIVGEDIVNPDWEPGIKCVELEIWKYNPKHVSKDKSVDIISLSLSLQAENDERIIQEMETMMEEWEW